MAHSSRCRSAHSRMAFSLEGKASGGSSVDGEVAHLVGVVARRLDARDLLHLEGDDQQVAVEGALPGIGVDEADDPAGDARLLVQLAQRGLGDGLAHLGEADGEAPHPLVGRDTCA